MKLKTNSGAKKRIKVSGGKAKRMFLQKAAKQHRLHQKSKSAKHYLRKGAKLAISSAQASDVRKLLPYA